MKIVVCLGDLAGCGYYRCIVPFMELSKKYEHKVFFVNSTSTNSLTHEGNPLYKNGTLRSVFDGADVVVLQRQTNPELLNFVDVIRKTSGAKIVFEFDDNFHAVPHANPNSFEYGTGKKSTEIMSEFIRRADHCIVSTPDLKADYTRLNSNISVCYNAMDDEQFYKYSQSDITGRAKRDGQIRIGYAGSTTHQGDFLVALASLVKVMTANPQVRMVFIGHDLRGMMPRDLYWRCEFAGATVTDAYIHAVDIKPGYKADLLASIRYYDLIAKSDLDMQIAPLASHSFNRSKSAIKLIQAGSFGTPVVCSRFGPYRQYIDEAPPGDPVAAGCSDAKEWRLTLEQFVNSELFRAKVGQANFNYVRDNHLISRKVDQWAKVITEVSAA